MLKKYLNSSMLSLWHQIIDDAQNIILIGHSSPDGDAMGATLAMFHYLKALKKSPVVIMPNTFPDFLCWIPGSQEVLNVQHNYDKAWRIFQKADAVICLDFSAYNRIDEMNQWLDESRCPRIIIDHHLNPELNADLLVSDPQACSTSEIVYCLLTQLGYDNLMTKECAMCIYCGMMTDTGGFIYNSSRPEIYYIISQLLEKGIDKDKIYRNVYNNYSVNRMRLMGYILNEKMVYLEEYKTSYFSITRDEMLRFHFKKGDAEGLVNLPLSIKGSILSVSLREDSEKELIRLSLRSVGEFPCNKMAAEYFNGGGHLNAAGGTLYCTMEEAIAIVNKAIKDYAPLLKDNKC